MSYAIIRSGGKQFRVTEGGTLRVPSIDKQAGETVELDVLMLAGGEGEPDVAEIAAWLIPAWLVMCTMGIGAVAFALHQAD